MSSPEKLCPFDKKPCIRDACAVWSEENGLCAFALSPTRPPVKKAVPRPKEKPGSSGLSGRFSDPLFD